MSAEYKFVKVTHVINPHLFWYHENHVPNEKYAEIYDLEKQLNQIDKENEVNPAIGTLVAVLYLRWDKLIRARVCETYSRDVRAYEIILWAIDYGFPFKAVSENVFLLPQKFTKFIEHVQRGGLVDILPAEKYDDIQSGRVEAMETGKWSKLACNMVKTMISEADTVEVMESFAVSVQSWVDIRLTTYAGKKYSVGEYLIKMKLAVKALRDFKETCQKLETTTIVPWLTNDGRNIFKEITISKEIIRRNRKVNEWLAQNEQQFRGYTRHNEALSDDVAEDYQHSTRELNQMPSFACPQKFSSPSSLVARVNPQKSIEHKERDAEITLAQTDIKMEQGREESDFSTQVTPSSRLYNTALIPSRTNLSNLKSYNSEEKSWHDKTNAVYDHVPDVKEKVLLDTFTTLLKEEPPISFAIAEIDQTVDFRKPNFPSNEDSPTPFRSSSPFTEIGEDKENLSGNKDIIDLNKLDLSGIDLDSHISTFSNQ